MFVLFLMIYGIILFICYRSSMVTKTLQDNFLILKSATHLHQKGPNNICSHTTKPTTPMCFNWLF